MHSHRELLNTLTDQIRQGDAAAAIQLHRELGPTVLAMVRQTMRPGGAKTLMDPRIRVAARRLGLDRTEEFSEERELLIHEVADSVCSNYIADLRSPPRQRIPVAETVGFSAGPSLALAY